MKTHKLEGGQVDKNIYVFTPDGISTKYENHCPRHISLLLGLGAPTITYLNTLRYRNARSLQLKVKMGSRNKGSATHTTL